MSRLGQQIAEVLAALDRIDARYALIGGLALASHNVVRATRDVDLLTDSRTADAVHDVLLALGYRCAHRSADAATYLRGDERIDLLYASRPVARRLLDGAPTLQTSFGALRVVSLEGLIKLSKPAEPLTSFFRTPSPPSGEGAPLTNTVARDPYELLDDLMCVIEELCPRWPAQPTGIDGSKLLL